MSTQLQYDCRRDHLHQQHAKYRVSGIRPNLRLGPGEEAQFEENLLELAPFLRSFAHALSRNRDTAQDLTQETLLRAWRARATFKPGTNLKAFLCTILRNKFYSDGRRTRTKVEWEKVKVDSISYRGAEQAFALDLSDTLRALRCLPDEQREALILVGAGGFSYDDVAAICDCPVGTVKSRVARARQSLTDILERVTLLPRAASHPQALRAADEMVVELALLAAGNGRVGLRTAPRNAQ
jgi:RNA polymerase sigma-70 factor (ECF subfamily)